MSYRETITAEIGEGPGTELACVFHAFFIRASADCPCKFLAALMNRWGCGDWSQRVTEDDLEFLRQRIITHASNLELCAWLAERCEAIDDTRLDFVLDSLHGEATRRRLPFSRALARVMVLRSIGAARRRYVAL